MKYLPLVPEVFRWRLEKVGDHTLRLVEYARADADDVFVHDIRERATTGEDDDLRVVAASLLEESFRGSLDRHERYVTTRKHGQ